MSADLPAFTVIIPARLASTRLPNKPLADIAGVPMIVRVAQQAARSRASRVVVAADDVSIERACTAHDVACILTRADHATGSDRLAEACCLLNLDGDALIVNVQGDEPLIDPGLIDGTAALLSCQAECAMSTAAHAIHDLADLLNPNVVKLVLDRDKRAMYFSRAPIPWWRDGHAEGITKMPPHAPLRHIGIYGYRADYLRLFPTLACSPLEQMESLEQLRALWHGHRIAVYLTESAPAAGVDTPQDLERVRALLAQVA